MIGKGKKTVSLAHKEKLLADIAYYEKRIEEALRNKKYNSFEDVVSSDDESNPYNLNMGPSVSELKQQEASLSDRTSMTLELAKLTIIQSEVNIMVTPPDIRRLIKEEGTWLEVAAECKIDLVSFSITFYAHKPHRRFGPTRFRGLQVSLPKPAHERELARSVLPAQRRPDLVLQVLRSYATAFRSRRTTLLELAEKYADKLKMEAMPEGGYRVRFLELLTVEWTLDNMWSPIAPFCHRMKFEVEYMPKDYIHTIGRLYKQFKDPSLETSERTDVLAQIFDTCLAAHAPARELQESLESDPETAGRLHERRTTIEQEPEMPPSHQVSPKKQSKGKENKAQNPKTNMAPPKTIPKKAKKVANAMKRSNEASGSMDVPKKSKPNEVDKSKSNTDLSKCKATDKTDVNEGRKGVKRGAGDTANMNAKKVRTGDKDDNSKSKSGEKTAKDVVADGDNSKSGEKAGSSKVKNKEVSGKVIENTKKTINKEADETGGNNSNGCKEDNANSKVRRIKESADGNNSKKSDEKVKNKEVSGKKGDDNIKKSIIKGIDEHDGSKNNGCKEDKANSKVRRTKVSAASLLNKDVEIHDEASHTRPKTTKSNEDLNKNKKVNTKNNDAKNTETVSTKTDTKSKGSKVTVAPQGKESKTSVAVSNDKGKQINNTESVAAVKAAGNTESTNNLNKKAVAKKVDKKNADTKNKNVKENAAVSNMSKQVKEGVASNKNTNEKNCEIKATSKNVTKKSVEVKNKEKDIEVVVSRNSANKITEKTANIAEVTEIVDKVKDKGKKAVPLTTDTVHANKAPFKNKSDQVKENNQKTKQNEGKLGENKSAPAKVKKINDQNKESIVKTVNNKTKVDKKTHENKALEEKSSNTKVEENLKRNDKGKGIPKTNIEEKRVFNNDKNKKSTTGTIAEKSKTVTKVRDVKDNDKIANKKDATQKKNNLNETFEVKSKTSLTKASNNQNGKAVTKVPNSNLKALLQKETSKLMRRTEKGPFMKLTENLPKIADKLKTKIPMMRNKPISTVHKMGGKNMAISKAVAKKTKIPMKSLPVFKKVVKNLPTRISPRKMPSTFKPSTQGFSNK